MDPCIVSIFQYIYLIKCNVIQFILSGNYSICFVCYLYPSSGAQTTVSTASGICHTVSVTCHYRGRVGTGLSVLWVAYSKHVEQFPDEINCVTLHLVGYIYWNMGVCCYFMTRQQGKRNSFLNILGKTQSFYC
jgi:hypothetical protein